MSCNTTCLLNYDNAPCIPIIAKEFLPFQFIVTYPVEIDLSLGTFRFVVSRDERGECPVLTIEEGDGLDITGQVLTLFVDKDHGLKFGMYYGEVRNDIDDDNASIILKVSLQINPTIARAA